jgi:hypothetical protein
MTLIYINVNFTKGGTAAGNFLSGKREGGERQIGNVRSKLGTAAGNFFSGKREGEREIG